VREVHGGEGSGNRPGRGSDRAGSVDVDAAQASYYRDLRRAEVAEACARILAVLITTGITLWLVRDSLPGAEWPKRCEAGYIHWLRWDSGQHCPCHLLVARARKLQDDADFAESDNRLEYLRQQRAS
jgi:hypothetical protein